MKKITEKEVDSIVNRINDNAGQELIKDFQLKYLIDEETNETHTTIATLILNGKFVYWSFFLDLCKCEFDAKSYNIMIDRNRLAINLHIY